MTRTYLVVFEKGKESWGAWAPDVPGTGGMGDTIEQARQSLREGIGYMLGYALADGEPFPEAKSTSVDFAEFDPNPADSHYEVEWLLVDLPELGSHADRHTAQAA